MTFVIPPQRRAEYLRRREEEFRNFSTCDFSKPEIQEDFLRMLHQIKGNSKTFGFEELGIEAERAESKIKGAENFPSPVTIQEFIQNLSGLLERYRGLLA